VAGKRNAHEERREPHEGEKRHDQVRRFEESKGLGQTGYRETNDCEEQQGAEAIPRQHGPTRSGLLSKHPPQGQCENPSNNVKVVSVERQLARQKLPRSQGIEQDLKRDTEDLGADEQRLRQELCRFLPNGGKHQEHDHQSHAAHETHQIRWSRGEIEQYSAKRKNSRHSEPSQDAEAKHDAFRDVLARQNSKRCKHGGQTPRNQSVETKGQSRGQILRHGRKCRPGPKNNNQSRLHGYLGRARSATSSLRGHSQAPYRSTERQGA